MLNDFLGRLTDDVLLCKYDMVYPWLYLSKLFCAELPVVLGCQGVILAALCIHLRDASNSLHDAFPQAGGGVDENFFC